jgi:hypothetical protein
VIQLERYSEPYNATGGLAAIGVLNQLGRPDTEPLEVLVREAVQNCWDAKRPDAAGIRIDIGRATLDSRRATELRERILVDPPPGLGLAEQIREGMHTLYVADFGTQGLGGPTRADRPGEPRDFVDFVRNIGQPPDKDFGGGSFGYGKAAFYIASSARTVVIDTLCAFEPGRFERRLLGCALGGIFDIDGIPYTGRHWWGRTVAGTPEPLTGDDAAAVANELGLPARSGVDGMGTTVLVIAPDVTVETADKSDATMDFIAEAIAWNFWPRMIDTPGGVRHTMEFTVTDNGKSIRVPNPRTHPRLRGFVEAMDRLRQEPSDDDDDLMIDAEIRSLRPVRRLGRLTIQKGPSSPEDLPDRPVPRGARITAAAVHHVALMRTPELVVTYHPGAVPVVGRLGYTGVFKCTLDVDEMFKAAEPPTHDDWVFRAVRDRQWRSFVKIALDRVQYHCRRAAGYDANLRPLSQGDGIPLGEFADSLAALMPGQEGLGARRAVTRRDAKPRGRRRAPGRKEIDVLTEDAWVNGTTTEAGATGTKSDAPDGHKTTAGGRDVDRPSLPQPLPPPQTRSAGDPTPAISSDGTPVVTYPFELRTKGNRVRLAATIEIMTNDGALVEAEPPVGYVPPKVHCWLDPFGARHTRAEVTVGPDNVDGTWAVEIELREEMMRIDLTVATT